MSAPFGGITYNAGLDESRLTKQLSRVRSLMSDGAWRTLSEISTITGDPESSVSARLRDLRKEAFGGHSVNRRRLGGGIFTYQLNPNMEGSDS